MIIGLRTSSNTDQRVAETADAQLVTDWFPTDVQSAKSVETPNTLGFDHTATDPNCGKPPYFVRFTWTDNGVDHIVTYLPGTSSTQLVRRHCTVDTVGTTVEDEHILAR